MQIYFIALFLKSKNRKQIKKKFWVRRSCASKQSDLPSTNMPKIFRRSQRTMMTIVRISSKMINHLRLTLSIQKVAFQTKVLKLNRIRNQILIKFKIKFKKIKRKVSKKWSSLLVQMAVKKIVIFPNNIWMFQ